MDAFVIPISAGIDAQQIAVMEIQGLKAGDLPCVLQTSLELPSAPPLLRLR